MPKLPIMLSAFLLCCNQVAAQSFLDESIAETRLDELAEVPASLRTRTQLYGSVYVDEATQNIAIEYFDDLLD